MLVVAILSALSVVSLGYSGRFDEYEDPITDTSFCGRVDALRQQLDYDKWSLLPAGGDVELMESMPKSVSRAQVDAVVDQYFKQLRYELDEIAAVCDNDYPDAACAKISALKAQIEADPAKLLPLEVEEALLAQLPKKVTPGLMAMMAQPFFDSLSDEFDELYDICFPPPRCKSRVRPSDADCREFYPNNGKVEYGRGYQTAQIICDSGYKAKTGADSTDLVSASRVMNVTCVGNRWDFESDCYGCEVGWQTDDALPGCYRLFGAGRRHIDAYRGICQRHLGDLASVHSADEFLFLVRLTQPFAQRGDPMIGLKADAGAPWEQARSTDGTGSGYTQWLPGEPSIDVGGDEGACAVIGETDGQSGMSAVPCDAEYVNTYICKRVPSKA